jgi:serine/threonine protein kinase
MCCLPVPSAPDPHEGVEDAQPKSDDIPLSRINTQQEATEPLLLASRINARREAREPLPPASRLKTRRTPPTPVTIRPPYLTPSPLGLVERALFKNWMSFCSHVTYPGRHIEHIQRVGKNTLLKFKRGLRLSEALTMEYVRTRTNIPVPRVRRVFYVKEQLYIAMDYIHNAVSLSSHWNKISLARRHTVVLELKEYLTMLRRLPPPYPGKIEAIDGEGCLEPTIAPLTSVGPFENVNELFNSLGVNIVLQQLYAKEMKHRYRYIGDVRAIRRCADHASSDSYRTVLTHGDLSPRNILVDPKTDKIVSIIDWEYAGWYPEYWEYVRAYSMSVLIAGPAGGQFFQELSDQRVFAPDPDPYRDEVVLERYLNKMVRNG